MDPATVAGLVFGIVPLIISAVENYEVTFQPFVTYKRHVKEIRRFTARLDTQRAIFHNECQLLLVAVGQNLGDILGDPNHPSRNDSALSRRLEGLLGTSYNTCVSTLNLINDTLEEVLEETAGFKDLLEGNKSKGKGTWSMFRQKIKISFSKTRLNEITNELRNYNEDLGRISAQIRRLSTLTPTSTSTTVENTTICNIKTTQQASIRLYDVLASGWTSDDCAEHVATMSLRVEQPCRHTASKVRFNMSVACTQQRVRAEPLWLAIESAPSDSLQNPIAAMPKPSAGLQSALQKMGAMKRSVKFDLTSTTMSMGSSSASSSNSQTQIGPQLDLCTMGKLCRYFRQMQIQAVRSAEEPCIGFLEKTKTFRHFVYPNQGPKLPLGTSKLPSLKGVLQKAANEKREQDWIAKLRLAKLLSLAVLRFHSTPWLSETWTSSDVHLLGDECASQSESLLEDPYVEAQLSAATSSRLISRPSGNASSLAANATLFSLGVVLIELGNDAPFESLYEKDLSRGDILDQVADFIAARRLGESVHKKLNMTYGRLVEKCLNCNFGVATKLDDAELQSAVVIHVVNELDVCIQQYRAFNSLAPPILCG